MLDDESIKEWIDDPNGFKNNSAIKLIYQYHKDGTHWWNAYVTFDGCVHFRRAYNSPFPKNDLDEDQEYIHICDIDEYVTALLSLKQKAIEHFGPDWP